MSELLTVRDAAAILKCSEDAVTRIFAKLPGVIDLGRAETRSHRRYRVLRIPKAVLEKYLSTKAGHPVHVDVPDRPERRRKSDGWEKRAVLNLAKAAVQNGYKGFKDRKVFERIATDARGLSTVPESYWPELISSWPWRCDEEEEEE
jgi:hypothetical protein